MKIPSGGPNTVLVFDYDATLVTDEELPHLQSVSDLIKAIRTKYGVPLVILTAGSVNCGEDCVGDCGVCRPENMLSALPNLKITINNYDQDSDACLFGLKIKQKFTQELIDSKIKYKVLYGNLFNPIVNIKGHNHNILDENRVKKLSILYHLIFDKTGKEPYLVFVDDMHYHNMGGLDHLIADQFETAPATYFQIKPLRTKAEANKRVKMMVKAIMDGELMEFLCANSLNIWTRYPA